jgi:hypothetical protein
MHPNTRALIAASAFAAITGRKVAGLYDHTAGEHVRIAAERQGDRLQAVDGERSATLGGTLPDLYDGKTFVSLVVEGSRASGYDRGSHGHYVADVTDRVIQLYDYNQATWFAFEAQVVEPGAPASVALA